MNDIVDHTEESSLNKDLGQTVDSQSKSEGENEKSLYSGEAYGSESESIEAYEARMAKKGEDIEGK